jgi:fibro-slime domain-containing protein
MARPVLGAFSSSIVSGCLLVAVSGCSAAGEAGDRPTGLSGSGSGNASAGSGSQSPGPILGGGSGPQLEPLPPVMEEKCEAVLELTLRDFQPTHPDFESYQGLNDIGCGMVDPTLGADSKPVFVSGIGTMKRVVTTVGTDIQFASCDPWNGWTPAAVITDKSSFDQWYRDVPGTNQTFIVPVTLPDAGGGNLVYDSAAFFPLDGMGFGNPAGQQHNFHFTTEGHVRFEYIAGQKFTFRGDDDLWIFVNGKLALDLGGMHAPISATIDFDARATELGIKPGGTYQMDIFHAERHTHDSNFRIETNIRCFEPIVVK